MTRILSLFVVFMLSGVLAFSQGRVVTGTVTDADGNAVDAASVQISKTNIGTTADRNGNFRLNNVPVGSILNISSAGFAPKDIKIESSGAINAILAKSKGSDLTTVTVATTTAFGIKRQPEGIGFAATTLNNKTLTQGKATGVAQALNGKVSSVSISTTNSGVFENNKILIRGIRSLTGNNEPLLVIDGSTVPLTFLSSIAPEDILSQTILKGASAAAVYGSAGSNGVILITTKNGSGNDKLNVSFSSSIQFTKVAFFPKLQHTFGPGGGEIVNPDGSFAYIPYENQLYGSPYDGSIQDIGVKLEDGSIQRGAYSNQYANDKIKFYNTGYTLQNNLSLSGKDFFVSIDDAVINGVVPDDRNRRTSFRFNGSKSAGKLDVRYGVNYVLQNYNVLDESALANYQTGSYGGGLFFTVLQTGDNVPLTKYKNWQNDKFSQYSNYYNEFSVNPYWAIGNLRQTGRKDQLLGNIEANYKLTSWMKFTGRVNTNINVSNYQTNIASVTPSDWAQKNRNATQYSPKLGKTFTSALTSNRINFDYYLSGSDIAIGKNFKTNYLVGGNILQNRRNVVQVGGNNLSGNGTYNVGVRSGDAITSGAGFPDNFDGNTYANGTTQSASYAVYGTLGFSYKDFAFIEAQARNEWDSRLLVQNRSFFYPGVNASLVLTRAIPSLKSNFLSFLKIRGSYSKTGNVNLGAYQTIATYSQPNGFPYGNTIGFSANNLLPDNNLTPEFQYSSEVGVEFGLLKDRIKFEATYYNSDNKNQILQVSKPASTGYTSALANAARFKNYGVDLDLSLSPLVNIGKAHLDLKLNAGFNSNKVLETFQNLDVLTGGNNNFIQNANGSPTVNQIARKDLPAFSYQLTDYLRDPQGRVIVDSLGNPSQASGLVVQGRSLPKWTIGATPSLTIGNITISMTWDYKFGHNFYSGLGSDMDFSGISARSAEYNRQNFIFPNSVYLQGGKYVPNTDRLTTFGNADFWTGKGTNSGIATNYFGSADALRLREVNLGYSMGVNGKTLKTLIFSVVGRNLFMIVPKSNQWGDPEFNSAAGNSFGISSSFQSPATRLFGCSIKALF